MRFYSDIAGAMILSACRAASEIRAMTRFGCVLAILAACTTAVMAEQQPSFSFQLLAARIATLSPGVDRKEATLVAECAYATVSQLRQHYRMFGTPIFNNFLVYYGFRQRGYCYQWAEDLLVALDALKLRTLELHWGESYAGTWRENNCVVVTAKGQPFNRGIILEAWRHFGHLRWILVLSDEDRYFENTKFAELVRARSASKTLRANRHVAFQARVAGHDKGGD